MSEHAAVILVVEDEAIVRLAAVDLVTEVGFRSLEAASADETIGVLERSPEVRLMFTDIDMPGTMDGLKLAHYVRKRWPPIQLIIASGKTIVGEGQLPAGARFFSKPYNDNSILSALTELLGDLKSAP